MVLLAYHFFFFNDTATTEIYTLSLHDALPISAAATVVSKYLDFFPKQTYPIRAGTHFNTAFGLAFAHDYAATLRSEEHTSELQSRQYLVCRLLLEKKKKKTHIVANTSI